MTRFQSIYGRGFASDEKAARQLGYKSMADRQEIMDRRQASLDWSDGRGDVPGFYEFLLADCSPFLEAIVRDKQCPLESRP